MLVEVIEAKNGFYIPMDGPWQSEEDDAAYAAAVRIYNDLKEVKDYVALIQSHSDATHGYWVETKEKSLPFCDHILKSHRKQDLHENQLDH